MLARPRILGVTEDASGSIRPGPSTRMSEGNESRLVRTITEVAGEETGTWLRETIAAISEADDIATLLRTATVEAARRLGVDVVPQAVVLDDRSRIRYQGRIDDLFFDLGKRRPRPRTRELRDAIDAVLDGGPVAAPDAEAIGCSLPEFPEERDGR